MSWAEDHRIETPEQIDLGLELAGPGSRAVAQVLDWLIKIALLFLLGVVAAITLAMVGNNLGAGLTFALGALAVVVVVGFWMGYDIWFEGYRNGQTPGKKRCGIRVVRVGGGPIDIRAAAIRNIVGLADFLPFGYLAGGILTLLSKHAQRLGDMAADTVVIREREEVAHIERPAAIDQLATTAYTFSPEQLSRLTPTDRHVLESYFSRRPTMGWRVREDLSRKLLDTFLTKTGFPPGDDLDEDPEAFLASLCRDLTLFHKQRL